MNFEIGVRSFSGRFLGPEIPLSPFFLRSLFVTRCFRKGFGGRTPRRVLEMFLVASGCAFL